MSDVPHPVKKIITFPPTILNINQLATVNQSEQISQIDVTVLTSRPPGRQSETDDDAADGRNAVGSISVTSDRAANTGDADLFCVDDAAACLKLSAQNQV